MTDPEPRPEPHPDHAAPSRPSLAAHIAALMSAILEPQQPTPPIVRPPPPSPDDDNDLNVDLDTLSIVTQHMSTETINAPSTSHTRLSNPLLKPSLPTSTRISNIRIPKFIAQLKPSLTLENSGSVARDHLASERTFLAYVRTSLAIASTGVALVQLFIISAGNAQRVQALARPLGAITILFGLSVLIIGLMRYFSIQAALTRGKFPVARTAIGAIAIGLGTLVAIVFAVAIGARG